MRSLKVVIIGETKVGKSCILSRFVQGTFDRNMPATIGAAFLTKVVETQNGGESVRLQLWDTAGQENFRSLAPIYYRSSSVAVLVFDVTSKSSIENFDVWCAEIADKAPPNVKLVVVGNKVDMVDERCISEQNAREIASSYGACFYCETSAKTGQGINELFQKIAEFDPSQDDIIETQRKPKYPDFVAGPGGCQC